MGQSLILLATFVRWGGHVASASIKTPDENMVRLTCPPCTMDPCAMMVVVTLPTWPSAPRADVAPDAVASDEKFEAAEAEGSGGFLFRAG